MFHTSPRQDGRNVPYASMDYMKKKKISFHALKDSFIRHSRIKACTGVATRPHAIAAHISIISLIDGSVHTSDRQIISYVITVTAKLIKFHVTHNVT